MHEDAEVLLGKIGIRIEEFDFGREDEPDVVGYVTLEWLDLDHERYQARLLVRPGISAEDRASFATWYLGALDRWLNNGPEMDGWQRRDSDAGWQLWCRRQYLPSLD